MNADDAAATAENRRFLKRALLVAAGLAVFLFLTDKLAQGF